MTFPTIDKVIASIESSNNQFVMRFEPARYSSVIAKPEPWASVIKVVQQFNRCSIPTAQVIVSTSYGLYQLMGDNLYYGINPYKKSVGEFMASQSDQLDKFTGFLTRKNLAPLSVEDLYNNSNDRVRFAILYNGSKDYSTLIKASITALIT